MKRTTCVVDHTKYELELDENQLRRRTIGDLITCEITDVNTSTTTTGEGSEDGD